MVDLTTTYLGLELRSPIVASASPITDDPDVVRRLEDAGAAAVVMPSLFEEEILHEELELNRALEAGSEHFAEALDYFPNIDELPHAGDLYAARLERIKAATSVPVIASLNATSPGGWTQHARRLQDAGADALELNVYHLVAHPGLAADDIEDRDLEIVAAVRAELDIPLAVKLSPYYSAMAGFAHDVVRAGADGLVLFNRFYQPDLDLDTLAVVPRVELSSPADLRLPLRWIAILSPQLAGRASLAATSGIARGSDVVKALLVGADVAKERPPCCATARSTSGSSRPSCWHGSASTSTTRSPRSGGAPATGPPATRARSSGPDTCGPCTPGPLRRR